ncbi:bacteriocin immunity protein [Agrilactobacillus yilanensis]|uniref:Bacteriocin immunity protein n=1 Tax=Agrilactobacillus yilanensis TaxID=2485997 RepID=A0ABW4J6F3_9LACO|nr:bacteriocin immunity protein [Agrilactobacillus yilanensis]
MMDQKAIFVFDQIEKAAKDKAVRKDNELSTMLQHFSDALEAGTDYQEIATKLSIAIAQYRAVHHFQPPRAIDTLYKVLVQVSRQQGSFMPKTINNWFSKQ